MEEEQLLREQLAEIQVLDLSKAKETRERSITIASELNIKNDELKESHSTLVESFEQLREAHKATLGELNKLKGMYHTLQASYLLKCYKEPSKDENACATNPLCVKASLIEKNTRLKAQLKRGLATCIQGEKNLLDLL